MSRIVVILTTATLIQATVSFHLDPCSGHLVPLLLSIVSRLPPSALLHKAPQVIFLKPDSNSAIHLRLHPWLFIIILNTKSKVLIMVHQDLLQSAPATSLYLSNGLLVTFQIL